MSGTDSTAFNQGGMPVEQKVDDDNMVGGGQGGGQHGVSTVSAQVAKPKFSGVRELAPDVAIQFPTVL
jgi:hypothetical protein